MTMRRAPWAVLSLVLCATAQAQSGRGTMTGEVKDNSGSRLQGALVVLSPGGATATTNAQGQYTITGLGAGQYTITITYSGYKTFTTTEKIEGGESEHADAKLSIASDSQSVEVYAVREQGEAEAISRTFNADNVINVLPFDVITSLPNANVADAIGRLPGVTVERDEGEAKYVQIRGTEPRLTHTTLDGVQLASPETVRQIKLDLIPANLVESVVINKTLEADQEGDGIGGQVDLRTKSAESKRPTIYLDGTGGYTTILGGRAEYLLDGTIGQRFLGNGKLGILFGGSYDYNGRGINDVEPGPALTGTYDLRDYYYYRSRLGWAGTVDYRFSDTSNIYLKGLYSKFNNFGEDSIYTPKINSFADATTLTQGGTDGQVTFQQLLRRPIQDIGGLQLGGNHVIKQSLFAWNVNASTASTRDDGYSDARFNPSSSSNPANNIQYNIDVSDPLLPHLNVQNGINIFNTNNLYFASNQRQYFYNPEVDLGFGASLAIPYTIQGHAGSFQFGGLLRNTHKFENQDTRNFTPNNANAEDPTLALTNFTSAFSDPNYYQGSYGPYGSQANFNKILAYTNVSDTGANDVLGNSFNQLERISAGFIMNTINLGKFRFIAGLRFENTGENNVGYIGAGNANSVGTIPVRVQSSNLNVLPSASLRYSLTPSSGIRVVYGRGLSRPNFGDLIPFQTVPSGGGRQTASVGNPLLKTEFADDIDLLYDNQLPHVGLLQAGFFYKNISNPIITVQTTVLGSSLANPVPGNVFLTQAANAGSAYIYGFEVSFQQHFTYLPGLLNGFGVLANYGYTASQATLPPFVSPDPTTGLLPPGVVSGPDRGPGGSTPPLLRQAPNTFNFSPTYDKRNLSVRLGLEYNQANIAAYNYDNGNAGPITQGGNGGGLFGPNGDNYFYSHLQLDLQGSYKLPKGFTAVAYALNLNNEVFGFYQGSTTYPVQREFYHQSYGGGLRWTPTRDRK